MIPLRVIMDGDNAFKQDLEGLGDDEWQGGSIDAITILAGGTQSGKPTIGVLVKCADGEIVVGETTWALLHAAVRAFEARYGAPV